MSFLHKYRRDLYLSCHFSSFGLSFVLTFLRLRLSWSSMAPPTALDPGQSHLHPNPALSSDPFSSQTELVSSPQASGQADQSVRPTADQDSNVVQALKGPQAPQAPSNLPQPASHGWRFWAIFIPMCVGTLLAAVETTVTSTALPTIVAHLNSGDLYVWIMNGYLLTRCVLLRSHGQCDG